MCKVDADDVVSMLDFFKDLKDPRCSINRLHLLGDVIVICVLAVLAGADGPKAIGVWALANGAWLKDRLTLPHGIPSHDTIGRVLALLKPQTFQQCFQQWLKSLGDPGDGLTINNGEHIAIDGKAARRSHDRRRHLGPLFLVSAWSVSRGISLGQVATAEKSNEITAIPELLKQIDVTGAVVTIDAAGCQTAIAEQIIVAGGNYVLALKGNQPTLYHEVQDYIVSHMENDFAYVNARHYQETVTGHGRVDTLTYYQLPAPDCLTTKGRWKGLKTIGVAIRRSEQNGKESCDVRYYICSTRLGVRKFAASVRGHWGIENTLHWCLDVTFREDESRLRDHLAAENIAWLKRFAISLFKQQKDKESIAMRRRMAGWNPDYLAQVIGLPTT
jgi:predicted transposase YbfD/YdcC